MKASHGYTGPVGLQFLDRPGLAAQLQLVQRAERLGFTSAWVAETRLTRDAISVLGAFATVTKSITLGAAVINSWTRGPVLTALSFATLNELAPGRIVLGLGTYSDALAAAQGIQRRRPVAQLRAYVDVTRRLLNLEHEVTSDGELVSVDRATLDLGYGVARTPLPVPIYLGATGRAACRLAGEVADGVLLNGFMSAEYAREARTAVGDGLERANRADDAVECLQLVNIAMAEERDAAFTVAQYMVTMYLGGQPHIATAAGIDPDLRQRLTDLVGGWPPRAADVQQAARFVDRATVERLTLVGTRDECRARLCEWTGHGIAYPILSPLTENVAEICATFAA